MAKKPIVHIVICKKCTSANKFLTGFTNDNEPTFGKDIELAKRYETKQEADEVAMSMQNYKCFAIAYNPDVDKELDEILW